MWLQDYLSILREIFEAYVAIRINLQRRIQVRGIDPTRSASVEKIADLVDNLNEAIGALGVGHQLVLRSNLPEVHLISSPPRCWVALTLQLEVVRAGTPTVLRMTHLGELHHFVIADPTADEIALEVLPHLRIAIHNGALCGARRFHLTLCAAHRVMVEATPMPFPLLPFLHVKNEPSIEWLLEAAQAMDQLVESFSHECRKRVRPPTNDLIRVDDEASGRSFAPVWRAAPIIRYAPR